MSPLTKTGTPRQRVAAGASVAERIALHIRVTPTDCWVWQAAQTSGYGRVTIGGKMLLAHRVSYEHFKGPIPEGLQIDHLCRVPLCVNPDHLEAVTASVNIRRGTSSGARAIRANACNRGHDRSIWGFAMDGRYHCHLCRSVYRRARKRLLRAGLAPVVDLDAIFRDPVRLAELRAHTVRPRARVEAAA